MRVRAARAGIWETSPAAEIKGTVTLLLQWQYRREEITVFFIKRTLILKKLTQLGKQSHLADPKVTMVKKSMIKVSKKFNYLFE